MKFWGYVENEGMNRWEARIALKLAVTNVVSRAQKALQVLLGLPLIQEEVVMV